jgi:UDP-GlcNAc:undecaprenyl-phosphate/decaprenyl-phosphate GlcNAc-1-phosphate transferase
MTIVWPPFYFVTIALVLLLILLVYLRLAKRYSLFDTPNERSSHSQITIRGGGVIFLIAVILYLIFSGGQYLTIMLGALTLGFISFIDDVKNLSAKLRLALHFIVILFMLHDLGLLYFNWILPFVLFFVLWLMNAYNFMDGINGITFMNTLSHLIALSFAAWLTGFVDLNLLILLIIANLIFGFFNFRKRAICFLGDVGSIPLGFLLISLTFLLIINTKSLDPLVFFALYMIDSGWTIAQRILKKENILKPHRKHLYQVLVNEYGFSHLVVSSTFFLIQMAINAGYFLLENRIEGSWYFIFTFTALSVIYIPLKYRLINAARSVQ